MLHERVTAIMDGQVTPLSGLPALSSAGSEGKIEKDLRDEKEPRDFQSGLKQEVVDLV